jgi:hypothetical protein
LKKGNDPKDDTGILAKDIITYIFLPTCFVPGGGMYPLCVRGQVVKGLIS